MKTELRRTKRYRWLVFSLTGVLFFSFPQNLLFAQTSSVENKLDEKFLIKFKDDLKLVFISPLNWDGRDVLTFSAVFGSGILLYALDEDINDWFERHRSSSSEDVSECVSNLGHGAYLAGLITALYASGEIFQSNNLRKTALLSLESWVASGVFVLGLKFTLGRARPQSGGSSHSFHPFSSRPNYTSFPSGHAASAFAVATTISEQSEETYVDVLCYSLATLVALSRIHDSKHWASDAFVGSALGYFVAKKVSRLNRSQDLEKVKMSFEFSGQRQAISFSFCF